jgi:CubicO group peptidase (beta-lactamase class C family)
VAVFRGSGAVRGTLDTIVSFVLGVVAKQFTAASVGLLVLDGAFNVQEDIRRYLPELPEYPSPVRVGHLLAHTSGLRSGHDLDRSAGMTARAQFSTSDRTRVIATATCRRSRVRRISTPTTATCYWPSSSAV